MIPEERAHELGLLRESDGMLNQREVFLLEEINRLQINVAAAEAAALRLATQVRMYSYDMESEHIGSGGSAGLPKWAQEKILALIPTSGDSALSKVIQEAKREEAELWHKASLWAETIFENYPGQYMKWADDRVAELRAALDPEEK